MITIGTEYNSVGDAKEVIISMLMKAGASYKVYKSDKGRLILKYQDRKCPFHVRVGYSKKLLKIVISAYSPHVCLVDLHFNFRVAKSVKF